MLFTSFTDGGDWLKMSLGLVVIPSLCGWIRMIWWLILFPETTKHETKMKQGMCLSDQFDIESAILRGRCALCKCICIVTERKGFIANDHLNIASQNGINRDEFFQFDVLHVHWHSASANRGILLQLRFEWTKKTVENLENYRNKNYQIHSYSYILNRKYWNEYILIMHARNTLVQNLYRTFGPIRKRNRLPIPEQRHFHPFMVSDYDRFAWMYHFDFECTWRNGERVYIHFESVSMVIYYSWERHS